MDLFVNVAIDFETIDNLTSEDKAFVINQHTSPVDTFLATLELEELTGRTWEFDTFSYAAFAANMYRDRYATLTNVSAEMSNVPTFHDALIDTAGNEIEYQKEPFDVNKIVDTSMSYHSAAVPYGHHTTNLIIPASPNDVSFAEPDVTATSSKAVHQSKGSDGTTKMLLNPTSRATHAIDTVPNGTQVTNITKKRNNITILKREACIY
jgi:hypothetical protein